MSARSDLATLLGTGGLRVLDYVPAQITPPIVVMEPADPWIEVGETFADSTAINFVVSLITKSAANDVVMDELEAMVVAAITVLAASGDYGYTSVGAPFMATVNGGVFATAQINVTCYVDLKEQS